MEEVKEKCEVQPSNKFTRGVLHHHDEMTDHGALRLLRRAAWLCNDNYRSSSRHTIYVSQGRVSQSTHIFNGHIEIANLRNLNALQIMLDDIASSRPKQHGLLCTNTEKSPAGPQHHIHSDF